MTDHAPSPDAVPPAPLVVEVLCRSRPALDPGRLAAALPGWDHSRAAPLKDELSFVADTRRSPVVAMFRRYPIAEGYGAHEAALRQTWDWAEASAAVAAAEWILEVRLITLDRALDRKTKLRLAREATQAAVATSDVAAIHWVDSERLVSPEAWRQSLEHGGRPSDYAINVRLFRVADGRPGEGVMDTLGLGAFDLPDLECHFRDLDLGRLAQLLFAYAEYLFDKGDVLNDDSLVRGIESHEEWNCSRRSSSVGPPREVVEFLPGADHGVA